MVERLFEPLADRYRRLSLLPRQPDRAKIHLIGPGILHEEWEDLLDDPDIIQTIMDYLRANNGGVEPDLRRGDVLVVEDYLEEEERVDTGKFSASGPLLHGGVNEPSFIPWNNDPEGNELLPLCNIKGATLCFGFHSHLFRPDVINPCLCLDP